LTTLSATNSYRQEKPNTSDKKGRNYSNDFYKNNLQDYNDNDNIKKDLRQEKR